VGIYARSEESAFYHANAAEPNLAADSECVIPESFRDWLFASIVPRLRRADHFFRVSLLNSAQ
jgi:hypothetical protein